jgi:hypothetical protein
LHGNAEKKSPGPEALFGLLARRRLIGSRGRWSLGIRGRRRFTGSRGRECRCWRRSVRYRLNRDGWRCVGGDAGLIDIARKGENCPADNGRRDNCTKPHCAVADCRARTVVKPRVSAGRKRSRRVEARPVRIVKRHGILRCIHLSETPLGAQGSMPGPLRERKAGKHVLDPTSTSGSIGGMSSTWLLSLRNCWGRYHGSFCGARLNAALNDILQEQRHTRPCLTRQRFVAANLSLSQIECPLKDLDLLRNPSQCSPHGSSKREPPRMGEAQ